MARSKKYRRTRNSLALGAVLLLLWLLDLGGISPREGQRQKEKAPTQHEESRGANGQDQVREPDPQPAKSQELPTGGPQPGPVRRPPEDLVEGRRATFARMIAEGEFAEARAWIAREAASGSPTLRKLAQECQLAMDRTRREREILLRKRIPALPLDKAEREWKAFLEDFPGRSHSILAELPEEVPKAPAAEDLARWQKRMTASLPVEIEGRGRLVRLAGDKAVLRVPGDAGGFRHERVELVSLPPRSLLGLVPETERASAARLLAALYAQGGKPLSAYWLCYGRVRFKLLPPDPGR